MELINLSLRNDVPYASSLEIAERFGKLHKNVLRDIRALEDTGKFSRLNFEPSKYKDDRGKEQTYYLLSRKAFTILVMGFAGEKALDWKIAYDDAFENMANLVQSVKMDTISAQVNSVQAQVQAMLSDVYATKRITQSENSECFRDSAKIVGVKETDLIALMIKKNWLYRRSNGRLCATARATQRGLIEEKFKVLDTGTEVVARTLLLPKGMHELRRLLNN